MEPIPFIPGELRPEIDLHLDKVRRELRRDGLQAALVGGSANIYYTTGRAFRGYVYIPVEGKTLWFVIRPTVFNPSDDVIMVRKPEQIPDALSERGLALPDAVGLEQDVLSYSEIARLSKALALTRDINCSDALRRARMVKTPWEIARMREDGMHQAAVYHRIDKLYKEDMTDLEFQIEIERVLRLEGCLGYPRVSGNYMQINLGSVINGKNADSPSPYDFSMGGAGVDPSLPVGADGSIMHYGTTVMVDMNGSFNGYQSDMTRVWRIGSIPELAMKAHRCACDILRALEKSARPGVEICELYKEAERMAYDRGLSDYFMGHRQKAGFIGHGVGIELNEQPAITPRCRVRLEEGMTLALEPKFVIPDVGAVGPENTYVVRPDGLESLTVFPEDIPDLL